MKDAYVPVPRVRSRRNPCKVMFLGIVAPPDKKRNFDGKIMLKRVSKFKRQEKNSHSSKQFSDDFRLTELICTNNDWMGIYTDGMPAYALFDAIQV